MSLLGEYTDDNGERIPPPLTSQSLAICLDHWRGVFINPSAPCLMKWPGGSILSDLIVKLKNRITIRDIKGICLSMIEANPEILPIDWVKTLYRINDVYSSSNDYFTLITEVCSAIPVEQKLTVDNWKKFLSPLDLQPLTLRWIYALRDRILPDECLVSIFLKSFEIEIEIIDPLTIELLCEFNLEILAEPLAIALNTEATRVSKSNVQFRNQYVQMNFLKWKMAVKQFVPVAEMVYSLENAPRLQATLCDIAAPTGPDTLPQKYLDYIIAHPQIGVYGSVQGIVPNISADKDNKNLVDMFKSIIEQNELTPPMIRVAFNICPDLLLNRLYNPRNATRVCRWISKDNQFQLTGVIDSLAMFTPDNMRNIINSYGYELKNILAPDARRIQFRTLNGGIGTTQDPMQVISQYLETIFNNHEPGYDWRFDPTVGRIYNAYERIQSTKLGKFWKPLIELLSQCAAVEVKQLQYSGVPTSRSSLTVKNIKADLLAQIYPEVVINTLNQISSTSSKRFYWQKQESSFIEYYTTVPQQVFEALSQYSQSFNELGLNLEDLAIRRATEKFQEIEKSLNRQVSLKGTEYARETKWQEILTKEERYQGNDRYRLTVTITSPDVIQKLYHLKSSSQITHLREISYIFGGIEVSWTCSQFFAYLAPYQKLNPKKNVQLVNNMSKSGFHLEVIEIIEKLADDITEVSKLYWQVFGVYNGYHYLPMDALSPQSYIDEKPAIPLDKAYSKNLINELAKFAHDKKMAASVKSYLNVTLMRARTIRKDGKLDDLIIEQLKGLISKFISVAQVKDFREAIKIILPEYGINQQE